MEEAEEGLAPVQVVRPQRPWAKRAAVGGVLGLGLAAAAVVACRSMRVPVTPITNLGLASGLEQKDILETVPARTHCAAKGADCSTLKCCQTSGHKCFTKDQGSAVCRAKCNPAVDGSCIELNNAWSYQPATKTLDTSMYCYTTYQADKGPESKPDNDLALLKTQLKFKVGIFACTKYEVFSDVRTELSEAPPIYASVVKNLDGEFHKFTREDKPYKWDNTPFFMQVWMAIRHNSHHTTTNWIVKVDPATVFLPDRLATHLAAKEVPSTGVYFENCKGVDSGFFGNIEVTSKEAFSRFLTKLEDCKLNLCWNGQKDCENWKYGPWGEDKFMQECMDRQSVAKVEDFKLSTSGTCPHDRPKDQKKNSKYVPPCDGVTTPAVHPFRTPTAFFGCLGTIMKKDFH